MEVYIGLDVSLASTAVCVLGEKGKMVTEAQVASAPDVLVAFMSELPHGIAAIGLEAGPLSNWLHKGVADALERVSERLPAMVIDTLREQWARVARLDEEIAEIERRIGVWHRGNADCKRIAEIPGVGVLTATAVVAAMGDPAAFRSGREFAAWLGLVPRHDGTGGRVRMLGISKRGGPRAVGRGRCATGRAWVYVRDDRPFGGADSPAALFRYSRDRSGDHPVEHLKTFSGIFQADIVSLRRGPPSRISVIG